MVESSQRDRLLDTLVKLGSIYGGFAAFAGSLLAFWKANRTLGAFFGGMAVVLLAVGGRIIWQRTRSQVEPDAVKLDLGTTDHREDRATMELRLITRKSDGTPSGDRVTLSWATLMAGAEKLCECVRLDQVNFTACIGINASGLVLANYIGNTCGINRGSIGAFLTGNKTTEGNRDKDLALPNEPDLAFAGNVLIVDSELKSGGSFRLAREYLMREFKCKDRNIWYAVLMICNINRIEFNKAKLDGEPQPGSWLRDLSGYGSASEWPIPNYVAYCTPNNVEMPQEIN